MATALAKPGNVIHTVLFKFKPEVPAEESASIISALVGLKGTIPCVLEVGCQVDTVWPGDERSIAEDGCASSSFPRPVDGWGPWW